MKIRQDEIDKIVNEAIDIAEQLTISGEFIAAGKVINCAHTLSAIIKHIMQHTAQGPLAPKPEDAAMDASRVG